MNEKALEMTIEENQINAQSADEEPISTEKTAVSELNEPLWSVVSFENCMAKDLTYAQAEQKLKELEAANVSGLCIVTNEVAEKVIR